MMHEESFSILQKISLIRQLPDFASLGWLDLHFLAARCSLIHLPKGRLIYKKGDPADAFYCVVFGRLIAHSINPLGQREHVEYIYRGMHFGIISLLTGEPHSLSFETLNDSLLLRIPQDNFKEILNRIPRLGVAFTYSLSKRAKNREYPDKKVFESTVISVYSPRRGVGSSFYAAHLAFHLKRESKKKVLFVDICRTELARSLQPGHSAAMQFKIQSVNFDFVLKNLSELPKFIATSDSDGPDVLSIMFDPGKENFSQGISRVVSSLANDYHYVVVDLPNQMDDFVFTALVQSDEIHLLVQEDPQELAHLTTILKNLKIFFGDQDIKNRLKIFVKEIPDDKKLTHERINRILDYAIYGKLPFIEKNEITEIIDEAGFKIGFPRVEHVFYQEIRKAAREIAGIRIALILGGGAALGLAHIGVLDVLEKENIPIDVVIGSSIGSVIAGFWALGKTSAEIEHWANEFRSPLKCLGLIDVIFPHSGLIAGWRIHRWLRKKIGKANFYQTKIPLKMTTYDIIRRQEIVLSSGEIACAIRKSISIPGIMRPVISGGQVFLDGGIFNPLPTNVATALGVQKIIAVNILKSPVDVQSDYEFLEKSQKQEKRWWAKMHTRTISLNIFDILVRSFLAIDYTLADLSAQQADVVIHPDSSRIDWYEFYKTDELIDKGRQAAYAMLDDIKKMIQA